MSSPVSCPVVFAADDQGPLSARRWVTSSAFSGAARDLGGIAVARRGKAGSGRNRSGRRLFRLTAPALRWLRGRVVEKAHLLGGLSSLNIVGAQRL